MSRSGYSYDLDHWDLIRWRGAVNSAIKGRRGQAFLKELATLMDQMSQKELIKDVFEAWGQVCALGVVGKSRGIDMGSLEFEDNDQIGKIFGIAGALAAEIQFVNDEQDFRGDVTPKRRWQIVRQWVDENLAKEQEGKRDE